MANEETQESLNCPNSSDKHFDSYDEILNEISNFSGENIKFENTVFECKVSDELFRSNLKNYSISDWWTNIPIDKLISRGEENCKTLLKWIFGMIAVHAEENIKTIVIEGLEKILVEISTQSVENLIIDCAEVPEIIINSNVDNINKDTAKQSKKNNRKAEYFNHLVQNLTEAEKGLLGYKLIDKGRVWKEQYKGKMLQLEPSHETSTIISIYFPARGEEVSVAVPTWSKLLLATARATAKYFKEKGIITNHGSYIGINALLFNEYERDHPFYGCTEESILLISIPEIYAHPCLNLNKGEKYLFKLLEALREAIEKLTKNVDHYTNLFEEKGSLKAFDLKVSSEDMEAIEDLLNSCFRNCEIMRKRLEKSSEKS